MPVFLMIIIVLAAVLFVALLVYYSFFYEPVNFRLTEVDIFIKGLELEEKYKEDDPDVLLEILHLSDFHLRRDRKGKKLFGFVKSLKDMDPDLILVTGDLVEQDKYQDLLIDMLKPLKAKLARLVVFGVHDYYNKTPKEFMKNMLKRKRRYARKNDAGLLEKKLAGIGFKVLDNKNIAIDTKPYLEIVGLGDNIIENTDIHKAFVGLEVSGKNYDDTQSCPSRDDKGFHIVHSKKKLRLALTHTPENNLIKKLANWDVDILFSGHTHGGQVRLPVTGAIISGCKLNPRYASGLSYLKNIVLYVTRGLGEGRYSPFRFYCQPEASYIRIRSL